MAFKIVDTPMQCCGIAMGEDFTHTIPGVVREGAGIFDENRYITRPRPVNEEDVRERLKELIKHSALYSRNCSLITLGSGQDFQLRVAKEFGFKVIHEFYNPNSGNQVYIMARTSIKSREEANTYFKPGGGRQQEMNGII